MRYLYRRGPGSKRRVMHLTPFDPMTGEPTMLPVCGRGTGYNTTINPPFGLGRPVCKDCQRRASVLAS